MKIVILVLRDRTAVALIAETLKFVFILWPRFSNFALLSTDLLFIYFHSADAPSPTSHSSPKCSFIIAAITFSKFISLYSKSNMFVLPLED